MSLSAGLGGGGTGRRRRGRAKRGALTEINMTPLIDVMLVLLIIFMVSATIMNAGIEVNLPKTEAAAMEASDEPLTVTVTKDGSIFIQDRPAAYEEIAPRLRAMTGGRTDRAIFLRGDGGVTWGQLAPVMAKLSTAGFTQINLITDTGPPPKAGSQPGSEDSEAVTPGMQVTE